MYRMQGETSSPEVSARVSQTALQESPAKKHVRALQKFNVNKRHVQGETSVQRAPQKEEKKSYHSPNNQEDTV